MSVVGESSLGAAVIGCDADGRAYLYVSRCDRCGDVRFPSRPLCPHDLSATEVAQSGDEGTIYEAVQMSLVPPGFDAPVWVGYVDLPGAIRVFSQLAWEPGESAPKHGDPVKLTMQRVRSGPDAPLGPVFTRRA